MSRPDLLIIAAWLVHAIAWLSPVHRHGVSLPRGLPGWEAFRVAFSPVWPYADMTPDTWHGAALSSSSALTNLVLLASIPIVFRRPGRDRTLLAWLAAAAVVINAQWFVLGEDRADLRIGYYLWWLSFIILATGVFRMNRGERSREAGTSSGQ